MSAKIIHCSIHAGGAIGLHRHETSDNINYVLSGIEKPSVTVGKNFCLSGLVTCVKRVLRIASSISVMIYFC